MKRSIIAVAVSTAVLLSAGVAFAQKGQGGGPKAGKTKVTQTAPKARVTKTPAAKSMAAAQGPKAPKPTTAKGPKTTGGDTTTAKAAKPKDTKTTSTTTAATTTATLSPVQQKLERNTNLAAKLQDRLPNGMNLMTAAEGFRSLGEFVSTVNASNNLGLSFEKMKELRLEEGFSLGQSIQKLKQDADGTVEANLAVTQAQQMIAVSEEELTAKKKPASKTTKATKSTKAPKAKRSGS